MSFENEIMSFESEHMLYDPKDYFRILMEIDMPAIINPFGEASFYMSQRFIKNVVMPQLQ